jgi:predicted enzyme related to lactoylglutathione lyase
LISTIHVKAAIVGHPRRIIMDPNHGKFVWYELMTTDTAAAAEFYGKVVGWESSVMPMEGPPYTIFTPPRAPMGVGGMMALPPEVAANGAPPHWLGYIYAEDVDAAAEKLTALGGQVKRPPTDIPTVGRFAVATDPQGAYFCLFKNAPMDAPPPPPASAIGQVGWRELMATDWSSAFDFYAEMFGWTKDMAVDMGPIGTYQTFKTGGEQSAGGMMTKMADMPMPFWGFYFTVDGIQAAAERVTAAGGEVLMQPHQVPGGSWICNCRDPQGAYFNITSAN